ncbi:GNAT family N-acetyltransferase [Halovulum sp. GXIMD14793]
MEIRRIERGDEAEWRRLWTAYLEFYNSTVPETVYRSSFDRLTSGDAREFKGFLALVEGKPVSLVHFLFHRHGWKVEDVVYLQDLYVDPTTRGTGAGRALIEAVYKAADAAGCPSVYWLTQDFDTTARKLYDQVAEITPFIKYQRRVA